MLTDAAFGFRVAGGPEGGWLGLEGADRWPLLTVSFDRSVSAQDQALVDRSRLRVRVCADLPGDALVHPLLGRMLPHLAEGRGIDAFHGGALVVDGAAWAVVGGREAGKSSLLAQCHRDGAGVVTDDIVVLERLRCLSGPRCIDLRAEPARRLGPGVPVRGGAKQRIRLPPIVAEVDLAGVIHLAWGPAVELAAVAPSDRVRRLLALHAEDGWPRDAALILDVAALPTFELRRPRRLDSLGPSAAFLLERLGAAA